MKKIKCQYCDSEFSSRTSSLKRHLNVCSKLYNHKKDIIESYNEGISVEKLKIIYNVDRRSMVNFLKNNNIDILISRNTVNHNYFKTKTSEMYWLLGLIASDGCVTNKFNWTISQSKDSGFQIISYIKSIINHSNKICTLKTIGNLTHRIGVSSEEMVSDLKSYGIVPKKTFSLDLPEFENEEYFKSYLRGYIDGDGCVGIYTNKKNSTYLCINFVGNEKFINSCVDKIPFNFSSKVKKGNVYELRYNGEQAVLFGNWLYSNNKLFKYYKYNNFKSYMAMNHEPKWSYYNRIYNEIKSRIYTGNVNSLSKEYNIPFQTIYHWKKNPKNIVKIDNLYCSF